MPALSTAGLPRPDARHPGPEPERLLAALVAGRADPRDVRVGDTGALVSLAVEHGLAPVLLEAVRCAGIDPAGSAWAPLVEHARWVASRYLLARVEQARIEAALAPLGIEWVWLKGYALAHAVYPRPALRPMLDLDLLVSAERCDEADRAVRALGYRPAVDAPPVFRGVERILHHHPALRAPSGVTVELHTRLHPSEQLLAPSHLAWFRAQTVETHAGGVRVRHLAPEAQLLHLAAHAILQHGEGDLRLQRYYDCHLLLSRTARFDWPTLLDGAAMLGWTYAVERALAKAHGYFQTPVPEHAWRALREPRARTRQATRATSLAIALTRPGAASARDKALGFAPSLLYRLYVGLRVLVPSPAYMRWRYAANGWRLPIAYARRWRDIARQLFAAGRRSPG
jgi:putative nucleotidyltransferase-like protein